MLLKNIQKLFSYNSRFICESVKWNVSMQNKPLVRNVLSETIEGSKIKSPADWKAVREELLNNGEPYKENNIDSIILGYCISGNKFNLGSSYIQYLNNEDINFNLAVTGKYFKLLYLMNVEDCFLDGSNIKRDQEELILQKYNEINARNKVLDSFTLENAIAALSLTKNWKKCIKLLEDIKVSAIPNSHAYSTTVAAAFLNKEQNLGWQLLQEMIKVDRPIDNIVYFSYINSLKKQKNLIYNLEKLFLFLQENDILIESEEVPLKLAQLGSQSDLTSAVTTVTENGRCKNCNSQVNTFDITEKEFMELKSKIYENVILGKDIFVKTDPKELEKFKEFISEEQKFDVVLDGLNIGYSSGTKHSSMVFSSLVASVVSYFVKRRKKVLVIGRYHMNRWPKDNWNYVLKNSTVFLTQDISQDDPFLLYCALNSGKETIVVTRDLMRSHKFLLKTPKLRMLFNRWLTPRQYQLIRVTATGNPIFRYPAPYSPTAQKVGDAWHIPFKNQKDGDFDIRWLCLHC